MNTTLKHSFKIPQQSLKITHKSIPAGQGEGPKGAIIKADKHSQPQWQQKDCISSTQGFKLRSRLYTSATLSSFLAYCTTTYTTAMTAHQLLYQNRPVAECQLLSATIPELLQSPNHHEHACSQPLSDDRLMLHCPVHCTSLRTFQFPTSFTLT